VSLAIATGIARWNLDLNLRLTSVQRLTNTGILFDSEIQAFDGELGASRGRA